MDRWGLTEHFFCVRARTAVPKAQVDEHGSPRFEDGTPASNHALAAAGEALSGVPKGVGRCKGWETEWGGWVCGWVGGTPLGELKRFENPLDVL